MSMEPSRIYLSWRTGRSSRRHIVGAIDYVTEDLATFTYLESGVAEARKEGFPGYTEFKDLNGKYDHDVFQVFTQRLTPTSRISTTSKFWMVPADKQTDKWSVLAYTQGLLSTDNFELLAAFEPRKDLVFITDLAGLSHTKVPVDLISIGDKLEWKCELENEKDKMAVAVYFSDFQIGYIKKVHCDFFHKLEKQQVDLSVYAIEKNGIVKNIFVKVSM